MNSILKRKEILLLLRLVVGATFVYASIDKVVRPDQFAIAVRSYQILPVSLTNLFALVLSWAELTTGLLLILGLFSRQAAGAIFLMLIMFIAALSIVMIQGMVIDCGCFSADGHMPVNLWLVVRNIFMAAFCVVLMRFGPGALSLQGRRLQASS
jgi:uncharacterized membrane protein YphA (DoxX/SURF4 family)